MNLSDPLGKLIFELAKLPGIGEKTATRLAHFVLKQDLTYAQALAEALLEAREKMNFCSICFYFTDVQPCHICRHPARDASLICVVERVSDALSIERSGSFRGVYHVLHGTLSPLEGMGPEQIRIKELLLRLKQPVQEILLAMNPSVEGETTALYLSKLIQPLGIKLTQLASGIPMGGVLEYLDKRTIQRALERRTSL